jgi:hypothetical protein
MAASSIDRASDRVASPSRRRFMAGCALLAGTPGLALPAADSARPELFAFAAPDRRDFVFALALPLPFFRLAKRNPLDIRLRAGEFCWTIRPSVLEGSVEMLPDGARLFSGSVWRTDSSESYLIAVAAPGWRIRESVGVWSEILGPGGARSRVGHPLVSRLLSGNDDLKHLHGETDPAMDRRLLSDIIARQIAARATDRRDVSPQTRGKRLADLLLPDLLWFDPARPGGFTFAAMNGRRPGDPVDQIIETLLAGAPRGAGGTAPYRASGEFPYFVTTETV